MKYNKRIPSHYFGQGEVSQQSPKEETVSVFPGVQAVRYDISDINQKLLTKQSSATMFKKQTLNSDRRKLQINTELSALTDREENYELIHVDHSTLNQEIIPLKIGKILLPQKDNRGRNIFMQSSHQDHQKKFMREEESPKKPTTFNEPLESMIDHPLEDKIMGQSKMDPIHKMENALLRCFQHEGVQQSLQNIVRFLQLKNKRREFELIARDRNHNKIPRVFPKMAKAMFNMSQDSLTDDNEDVNLTPNLNILGVNKQICEFVETKPKYLNKQRICDQKQSGRQIISPSQNESDFNPSAFPMLIQQTNIQTVKEIGRLDRYLMTAKEREKQDELEKLKDNRKFKQQSKQRKIKEYKEFKEDKIYSSSVARDSIKDLKVSKEKPLKLPSFLNYLDINMIINLLNKLYIKSSYINPNSGGQYFKIFVGKGNNSQLVKQTIRSRPNWVIAANKNEPDINFFWTQTFKDKIYQRLKKIDWVGYSSEQVNENKQLDNEISVCSQNESTLVKQLLHRRIQKKQSQEYDHQSNSLLQERDVLGLENIKIIENSSQLIIFNHLKGSSELGNKKVHQLPIKSLFSNLRVYYINQDKDVWTVIPQTFHINGKNDPEYQVFIQFFKKKPLGSENVWIIKPGENSNRGNGIVGIHFSQKVTNNMKEIDTIVRTTETGRSVIIQKYIERPFLYQKRKFDIRCYSLITVINGIKKAFWYKHGYLRTASKQFNLNNFEIKTHLTNDAVQNKFSEYGKYEKGNKVSYEQFQAYLKDQNSKENTTYDYLTDVYPQMKQIASDAIISAIDKFEGHGFPSFELFGIDYMLDWELKPLLIEFNTNPCIELGCPVLQKVITTLIDNLMRLVVDPLFSMQQKGPTTYKRLLVDDFLHKNSFELIWQNGRVV